MGKYLTSEPLKNRKRKNIIMMWLKSVTGSDKIEYICVICSDKIKCIPWPEEKKNWMHLNHQTKQKITRSSF